MSKAILLEASYRNPFEQSIAAQLEEGGVKFTYETLKLPVAYPPRVGKYTPDFITAGCNIILEGKGYFYNQAADRQKLILAKEQHPNLDIRIVFQNANTKIYKGSKTTYGKWASDHNFMWSDKGKIPKEWLNEIRSQQSASGQRSTSSKTAKHVGSGKPRWTAKAVTGCSVFGAKTEERNKQLRIGRHKN